MSPARLQRLLQLLAQHPPLDERESDHLERMRRLADLGLAGRLDPFSRRCFVPGHFTASSFVLSPDDTSILLILHAKLGLWLQPGGHVDPTDPSVLIAARREVAEETGLCDLELLSPTGLPQALLDVDIHLIPARPEEPAHEHFDLRFLFRSAGTALEGNDEVRGVRWVPLDQVGAVRSDASVMRAITRTRSLVASGRA